MATYNVDTTGHDDTGDGSIGNPWLTVGKACTTVTTAGDIIHVNAGTYTITTSLVLSVGVNIEGDGVTSVIKSNIASTIISYALKLESATEGTNGNQTVSYLKFDGDNLTADKGILVSRRKNVSIHHITIENFSQRGFVFSGAGLLSGDIEPITVYALNNQVYNCTITNCSSGADGAIRIGGQDGMLIHNNTFNETARGGTSNGEPIKFFQNGYLKGVKIYDNSFTMTPRAGFWPIELWAVMGGCEIYGNTMTGGGTNVDDALKGSYTFSIDIRNNTITNTGQPTVNISGVSFDGFCSDVIVKNNNITNMQYGIFFNLDNASPVMDNISIYNNIIDGIGKTTGGGMGIFFTSDDVSSTLTDFDFFNNVIYGRYATCAACVNIATGSNGNNWTRFTAKNNIFIGGVTSGFSITQGQSSTFGIMDYENNITYGCGNSNEPRFTITPSTLTNLNNIKADPTFVSTVTPDFNLQTGSSAIGAGIGVGLSTDYAGNLWNATPSIGAYEYNILSLTEGTWLANRTTLNTMFQNIYNRIGL